MTLGDSISGALEFAKRKPMLAIGAAGTVVVVGVAVYLRGGGGGASSTPAAAPPVTTGPDVTTPSTPGMPGLGTPPNITLPGFPPGAGPSRPVMPPPRSNMENMPGKIIGHDTGAGKSGGKPGDVIDQKGKPYSCPAGTFLTYEKGGTGHQVCQRKDGTQFAVVPNPVKAKKK